MSGKFNLKDIRKSRTLLEPNEAKEVLTSEIELKQVDNIDTATSITNNATESNMVFQKRGRPPIGKRSNPDYMTALAYIRKDTYHEVRNKLFLERREYSDLIQELLENWLKSNK